MVRWRKRHRQRRRRINQRLLKGYGTAALREIIRLAQESGKYNFLLIDYAPDNKVAEHVYTKLGFRPTGVFEHGEYELRLDL